MVKASASDTKGGEFESVLFSQTIIIITIFALPSLACHQNVYNIYIIEQHNREMEKWRNFIPSHQS